MKGKQIVVTFNIQNKKILDKVANKLSVKPSEIIEKAVIRMVEYANVKSKESN